MQNVFIATPYRFVAPDCSKLWWHLFRPILSFYLRRSHGITGVECRGVERLRASLAEGHGIMLAPNHCRPPDPMVPGQLSFAVGHPFRNPAPRRSPPPSAPRECAAPALGSLATSEAAGSALASPSARNLAPRLSGSRLSWSSSRQTHRHADPGKAKTYTKLKMIELRVLGTRGVEWVQQQVRVAEARPLGAWPEPPAPVGKKREPGAPRDEAEVCRLNPTPGSDSIAP